MHSTEHADVLIVGGGPVGALAALRFAAAGQQVILLEARAEQDPVRDARALALSWHSWQQLCKSGIGQVPNITTPIDTVHVSQQGHCGRTVISREDLSLPHLGVVVDYPSLVHSLPAALAQSGVQVRWQSQVASVKSLQHYAVATVQTPQGKALFTGKLIVLAEGGALAEHLPGIKRLHHDYQQSAFVVPLQSEQAAKGVAYERFSQHGPLALLPYGTGFMLVWTRSHAQTQDLMQRDEASILATLQQAFGERQGRLLSLGQRASFPLVLRQLNRVVSGRIAMIGNAAQTMHPVAAQGLNLGIRDACALNQAVGTLADPGDQAALRRYAQSRKLDSHAVVGFTHSLIKLFDQHTPLTTTLRGVGMNVLDALPPLRRRFASHLVFGV